MAKISGDQCEVMGQANPGDEIIARIDGPAFLAQRQINGSGVACRLGIQGKHREGGQERVECSSMT